VTNTWQFLKTYHLLGYDLISVGCTLSLPNPTSPSLQATMLRDFGPLLGKKLNHLTRMLNVTHETLSKEITIAFSERRFLTQMPKELRRKRKTGVRGTSPASRAGALMFAHFSVPERGR
jgi:hypothetical protein